MADVDVSAGILVTYLGPETDFILRIKNRLTFLASNGTPVIGESSGSEDYFIDVPCTVTAGEIHSDAFNFFSTTDALTAPPDDDEDVAFHYRFDLHTTDGKYHSTLYKRIQVPPTPNPTTLAAIIAFNEPPPIPASLLASIYAYIANLLANLNKATELIFGLVRLSVPADDPSDPIAVGINDPIIAGGSAGNETDTYRSNPLYSTIADAVTAAYGNVLAFTAEQPITVDTTLPRSVRTRLGGFGVFNVSSTRTLTIEAPSNSDDRKWNIGPGAMVMHTSRVRMTNWTGINGGTTTPTAAVNSSQTSITVNDASVFGVAPFPLAMDHEIMNCTAVAGNVLTVVRGFDGTTAAQHKCTTTAAEAVDISETVIDVANSSAFGAAPFLITVDSEQMRVVDNNTGTNQFTVLRGYYSTAATHSNGATITKVATVYKAITTKMRDGIIASLSITGGGGGGILEVPLGLWAAQPGWLLPSNVTVQGPGTGPECFTGGVFINIGTEAMFKIGENLTNISICDLGVDMSIAPAGSDALHGVMIRGAAGTVTYHSLVYRCSFMRGSYGVSVTDSTGTHAWQCTGIDVVQNWFSYQEVAGFHTDTSNIRGNIIGNDFTPAPNGVADGMQLYYSGTMTIANNSGNGINVSPQAVHTAISTIETRRTTLTEDLDNSETAIDVADGTTFGAAPFVILIDDEQMNVTSIASNTFTVTRAYNSSVAAVHTNGTRVKLDTFGLITMSAAHQATVNQNELITITTTGSLPGNYTAKQRLAFKAINTTQGYAYEDPKTSFTNEWRSRYDFTSIGSSNTLRTNIPVTSADRPRCFIHIEFTFYQIEISDNEDEGFPYSIIVENTFEKQRTLNLYSNSFQGLIYLKSMCKINSSGNWYLANAFKDLNSSGSDAAAEVWSVGDSLAYNLGGSFATDLGNTLQSATPTLSGFLGDSKFHVMALRERSEVLQNVPLRLHIGHNMRADYNPAITASRESNDEGKFLQTWALTRRGTDVISKFYNSGIIEALPTPTYAHTVGNFLLSPGDGTAEAEKGVYIPAPLTIGGPLRNTAVIPISSTANVTSIDCTDGDVFYMETLAENTTLNATGLITAVNEIKTIFIVASTTNYFVAFGAAIKSSPPFGFNTGSTVGKWTITLRSIGGVLQLENLTFNPESGDGVGGMQPDRLDTGTTRQMVPNIPYIAQNGGAPVVYTLPVKMNAGDKIPLIGSAAGGWRISQNASQQIVFNGGVAGQSMTTSGTGGYITSQTGYESLEIYCTVADTYFEIRNLQGTVLIDGTFPVNPAQTFGIPILSKSANHTTVLNDANRGFLHPLADTNNRTITIDSNANVPYPIGTQLWFFNEVNTLTIAITSDTLTLQGAGTTGSRTLAADGTAKAIKTSATKWKIINYGGLT